MRTTRVPSLLLGCLALLSVRLAAAQDLPPPPPVEQPRATPFEWRLSAGAGVSQISGDRIDDLVDLGGAWNVRATFDTRNWISWEAAYVGTANNIQALGLDADAYLMSNGLEGTALLHLVRSVERLADVDLGLPVEPYVLAGAAVVVYDLVNEDFNTSNVREDDNTIQLPFGAGVSSDVLGFTLDGRFTWRAAFDSDLLLPAAPGLDAPDSSLDNWQLSANAGWTF